MEFGADDTVALAAYVANDRAAAEVDCPWEQPRTVFRQEMSLRFGYDGEIGRYFLLQVGSEVVGTAALFASDYDNLELAWVEVVVRPDLRRRGHGRAGLDLVLAECRRIGRPLVLLYGWESGAARGFAASAGFAEKSLETRRVHDLVGSPEETERFRALYDEAVTHAAAYELLTISGPAPDELLPGLAEVTAAINDAPLDDLEYEDEVYDADRVRAYEQAQVVSGYRMHRVVARHRESGALVAHTVVSVDTEQPAWAEQHDTAVVPEHRGHRLGMVLKAAMLLHLATAEPQLRCILTENAASNGPMIAVNEQLGHRIAGRQLLFQRRL